MESRTAEIKSLMYHIRRSRLLTSFRTEVSRSQSVFLYGRNMAMASSGRDPRGKRMTPLSYLFSQNCRVHLSALSVGIAPIREKTLCLQKPRRISETDSALLLKAVLCNVSDSQGVFFIACFSNMNVILLHPWNASRDMQ